MKKTVYLFLSILLLSLYGCIRSEDNIVEVTNPTPISTKKGTVSGKVMAKNGIKPIGGALVFTFLKMPNPQMQYWTDGWTTTMNIYSQVGLVTLIGLIAKNGILVVEFANKLQEQGKAKLEAVREAAITRLRPILMTSIATVAGHFPLVLVTGAGAEARNSIGLVLVGGMAIGTLFTLFVIPAIYMLIAKDHRAEEALAPVPVPAH